MPKRALVGCIAVSMIATIAAPASACQGPQFESTIDPVMEDKPALDEGALGTIFKIRYSGERSGREDRLWPNFYVVEVLEGKMKGRKVLIPAHVTSCDSVFIADGAVGYVMGSLRLTDRNGELLKFPILSTGFSGTRKKFSFD